MKIGILTYHRAHNYGAMLQAYALQKVLQEAGHDACFIDYWPKEHEIQYALIKPITGNNFIQKIKCILASLLTFIRRYQRIRKFKDFSVRFLHIGNKIQYTEQNQLIKEIYDCVIVGSDQIWRNFDSSEKHIGFDPTYFCQNIAPSIRCISYAASMGVIKLDIEDQNILKQYLCRFDEILVRENNLKEVIDKLGYKSKVVLDPTLLLTKEQWNTLLPKKQFCKTQYVLYYELKPSKEALHFAQLKAKELGCRLLIMDARISLFPRRGHISYASPIDFLHAIRDAKYIIATSFHGTAFSIIFEKQFQTIGLNKNADRVITLLQHMGISEHYQEHPKEVEDINYNKLTQQLHTIKSHSINLLLKATKQ